MSSRNQDVKGFNIHDQVQVPSASNSGNVPHIPRTASQASNNMYDCRPSSKLAAQKDRSRNRMYEVDAKLEQLKQEREQKLRELEEKKKLMQHNRQVKLNKLKSKHTNSNSSLNSESSNKANLYSNPSNNSNKSTEENS